MVHFYKQVLLTDEDRENLLLLKCCCCYTVGGGEKKCLFQYYMGNKQIHIRCAWSQRENKVIALHLNLSADESSLEGKKNA